MNERREIVQRWITKAEHDYHTACTMLQVEEVPTDVVCFHCQQCAEKYLKAFLTDKNQEAPPTHDLRRLFSLCVSVDSSFEMLEDACVELTDYAVEVRYVDDWRDIPLEEANAALKHTQRIREFAARILDIE